MEPSSLPFFIPKVYEGLAKAHGIARITRAGLTLEFEVKDGFVGVLKSALREVVIPLDDLQLVELRTGWFKSRLFIRTRRMATLQKVPGNHAGGVELGVSRQDRNLAEALVSVLRLNLSERELEKLGRGSGLASL
jgi:hypothetical protein